MKQAYLPYLFSTLGMIIFAAIWFLTFAGPYQANGLSLVIPAFLLSAVGSMSFSAFCYRYFSKLKRRPSFIFFGLISGLGCHFTVVLIFVLTVFMATSWRDGILQLGIAWYYPLWLIAFGLPISLSLGIAYGLVLSRFDTRVS